MILTELEHHIQTYFGLSQQDLSTIARLFSNEIIPAGDFYAQVGKPCLKLSFIRKGYLRVFKETEDRTVTQWISTPGYFVTDLSSLTFQTPARWNIQALSDCELYTITWDHYRQIGQFVSKWPHLEKLFIAKCFLTLEDRVFSFLSMPAEERYLHLFNLEPDLFLSVPLQYLASMLGMTPETLSRIRKKLSSGTS
jgi:CRP-like cAMP-binding protein